MNRLKDKVAIITGAAGGIGAATARLFTREGAKVMATDKQAQKLRTWIEEEPKGFTINCLAHDVVSESDWKKVVDKTIALYGQLDILVNNAGIFPGFISCEDTTCELWQKVITVNLTGPFLGCKTCIPFLREAGGGSIINISSVAGIVGGNGAAYSSSKGGLRLLTKDLAVSLAKDNIRINSVCPGAVLTPMTENLFSEPGMDDIIRNMSPQARAANAVEIALAILYLASDESSFVTGSDLTVDGGAVAR